MRVNSPGFLMRDGDRDNGGCAVVGRWIVVFLRGVVGGRVDGTRPVEGTLGMEDAFWVRDMLRLLRAGRACGGKRVHPGGGESRLAKNQKRICSQKTTDPTKKYTKYIRFGELLIWSECNLSKGRCRRDEC